MIDIRFGEIWLKGRNRGKFVKRLYDNAAIALKGEKYERLENKRDRLVLHLNKSSSIDSITEKLGNVFGISWFAPVIRVDNDLKKIIGAANSLYGKGDVVRIVAHRSDKSLDFDSRDIVSEFIKNQKKLKFAIDKNGEKEISINATKDGALLHKGKIKGLGGLPVGVSGKAVIMLSGGIDSPLASFYAMKKGLEPVYVHMHAFPTNEQAEKSKMKEITDALSQYSPDSKIYYVPSHLFTASIVMVPKKFELVLFKRFLYRLSEKVAAKEKASVIANGESLGQVASQTVENITSSEKGTKIFVMRPLIGMDKQEIINKAKELGTYEISIKKYPDVCSLRARNPATMANAKVIDGLYKECKLNTVLAATLKKADVVEFKK